jgi:CTP:molybdopterin cytidylyltransferase MocA
MNNKQPKVAAIIVAAGDSQRMEGIGKVVYEG